MKCPTCTEPSKVYFQVRERRGKIAHDAIFWDETDRYHVHDLRPYVSIFVCEHGHRFKKEELESCPSCKFGHEDAKIVPLKGAA